MNLEELKLKFNESKEIFLDKYFEILKFKTESAKLDNDLEFTSCANWLQSYLSQIGFDVEIVSSGVRPVIIATRLCKSPDAKTVLFYNHYDVQPSEPDDQWLSDPFVPVIRDGRVFARGAQDNKGQMMAVLTLLKVLHDNQDFPELNIKLVIEGEEEIGSSSLVPILSQFEDRLKSDLVIVTDIGFDSYESPSLCLGVRGIIAFTLKIHTSKIDLHSGVFGGVATNPISVAAKVISSFHDQSGRVLVDGFYDDVVSFPEEELSFFNIEPNPEIVASIITKPLKGGELYMSIGRSRTLRPTLEINGINSGYSGDGFKTVLPESSIVKFSIRLVSNQDPKKIISAVNKHVQMVMPHGVDYALEDKKGAEALLSDPTNPIIKGLLESYKSVFKRDCKFSIEGGSIPISKNLSEAAGAPVVFIGTALPNDNIHAPNESYGLDQFEYCYLLAGSILNQLSKG